MSIDRLVAIVYDELKSIAATQLGRSGNRNLLQTTALVHEAFEKLTEGKPQRINDRRHFFAIASRAMRQIVVDSYRARQAAKRGGGAEFVELLTHEHPVADRPEHFLAMDQALARLAGESPELAEIVDLSGIAGLSNPEIAELLGTDVRTVQRKLARARAWLASFVGSGPP